MGRADPGVGSAGGDKESYVVYCRIVSAAFFLVAFYTLAVKIPSGGLEGDWMHTLLHVATGAVALHFGWVSRNATAPRLFTTAIVLGYGLLGVVGWFIAGIALGSRLAIPLGPADNIFHLLLTLGGLAAIFLDRRDHHLR